MEIGDRLTNRKTVSRLFSPYNFKPGNNYGRLLLMKKLVLLVGLVLLTACGNEFDAAEIETYIDKMREHAELREDFDKYKEDLREFTDYLQEIDNEKYAEYIEKQIEANEIRLEGLEKQDPDLITKSSALQAQALQILNKLKESE